MVRRMLRTLLKYLLCCMLFCSCTTPAQSTPRVVLRTEVINLGGHLEMLRDPGGLQNLDEVTHSDQWQASTGNFNPGFTSHALWLRVRFEQPLSTTQDWQLEVNNSNIDDIRLYHLATDSSLTTLRAGRSIPYNEWPVAARAPTFPLLLTPGIHVVYLRIQSEHPISAGVLHQFHCDISRATEQSSASIFPA